MKKHQERYYTTGSGKSAALVGEATAVVPTWYPAPIEERNAITSPEAAADTMAPYVAGADRERCIAAMLDVKHRILGVQIISMGSVDHTFMSPREVYRDALNANAAALVIGHNHPSGDPEPSDDDERVTRRLTEAGEVVGIDLLDHLVFGGSKWISLARRGAV